MLLDWADAHALAKPIRTSVFIQEQQVSELEEWDDEDSASLHVLAFKDGEAVATARLTQKGKIGRMAVLKAHRKQGIGAMMLVKLIEVAKQRGLQEVKLWSQTHAQVLKSFIKNMALQHRVMSFWMPGLHILRCGYS